MKSIIVPLAMVMLVTTGLNAAVSDHVFVIELATTYEYGKPGDVLFYVFDASLQVDETVVSATVQDPGGGVHSLVEEDEEERWLGFFQPSPDLAGLADFLYGTFTFTVEYSDGSSESTSVNYAMGNGDPIAPVTQQPQFIYPAHNQMGVPLEVTFQFVAASDPTWDITLEWEPEPDCAPEQSGGVENLPYNTTSYGPVILTPDTLYSAGIAINNAVETVNADGILVMMDMDAETHILFTTASDPNPDPSGMLQELDHQVVDLELHHGLENSLLAKLRTAWKKLQDDNENNDKAAINSLAAFIDAVNEQRGDKITEDDADSLIAAAQEIIDILSSG